jgi:hypothetical protein
MSETNETNEARMDAEEASEDTASSVGDETEVRLRHAIDAINITNSLSSPILHSIGDLLELAGDTLGSDNVSVLVSDGDEGGLRFVAARGEFKEKLPGIRIPPGKGIAGLVFSSGQPMAVSDVSKEGSFWSEVDTELGFKTLTVLATPLETDGKVVGVLEFVNRAGAPPYAPFTPEDMDRAAQFAAVIARLVESSEMAGLIEILFERSIKGSMGDSPGGENDISDFRKLLKGVPVPREYRELALSVVTLLHIVRRGDAERELCIEVLDSIARFMEKRPVAGMRYFSS